MESGGLTSTASSAEGRVGGEVRHVLETVEVPGGEEQRGLYAKMLVTEVRASGTRERVRTPALRVYFKRYNSVYMNADIIFRLCIR